MDDIEIPEYFICPISLQIMADPVTTITGITYDRQSIEKWLSSSNKNKSSDEITYCPVTKQPFPRDSDLTPNHTLRRLIQSWCTENASHGINRIPTPKPLLDRSSVAKMIKGLQNLDLQLKVLRQLEVLAAEKERNKKFMVEAGVPKAVISFIVTFCYNEGKIDGLEESLSILHLIGVPSDEARMILLEDDRILESLTWVLGIDSENRVTKAHTIILLRTMIESSSSHVLERLKPELFGRIVGFIRDVNESTSNPRRPSLSLASKQGNIVKQAVNAALVILLETCTWSRNRVMMIESGAIFHLIELELNSPLTEKRSSELTLGILSHLCSCADGRAEFLSHRGGVAVVTKRILRVSPATDDRALMILSLLCKFFPTGVVVQEMAKVRAVAKLCMVLQVDCPASLKERAREILRAHADEWKRSPCVDAALITKYTN